MWRGQKESGPGEDLFGLLWGSGGLEVFLSGPAGVRSWKSPEVIQDVARLRWAVAEGIRHLGCRPGLAVMVLLHPELVQHQIDVPAAAPASTVRTLVQRSLDPQKSVPGPTRWRDISLIPSGDRARRLVYSMPEDLYQSIRTALLDLGIEVASLVPFSGLAFLDPGAEGARDTLILEAWHLPCGLVVGLRRGLDLWMARPLVLDPDDARRISRELRQTLGFAREHWALASPRIRLRGPGPWTAAVTESLRLDGLGNEVVDASRAEDWRCLVLRRAMGSGVDLVPASLNAIRRGNVKRLPISGSDFVVASVGLLLSVGMLVGGHRVLGRTAAVVRDRLVVEQMLEEVEAWVAQREQSQMLIRPWESVAGGIPVEDLTARIGDVIPDGLVLTELDLWRVESGWHLALSGRSGSLNEAASMAALDKALASGIGALPASAISKQPPLAVQNASWADLLAGESHATAAGAPIGFRREWVLP